LKSYKAFAQAAKLREEQRRKKASRDPQAVAKREGTKYFSTPKTKNTTKKKHPHPPQKKKTHQKNKNQKKKTPQKKKHRKSKGGGKTRISEANIHKSNYSEMYRGMLEKWGERRKYLRKGEGASCITVLENAGEEMPVNCDTLRKERRRRDNVEDHGRVGSTTGREKKVNNTLLKK